MKRTDPQRHRPQGGVDAGRRPASARRRRPAYEEGPGPSLPNGRKAWISISTTTTARLRTGGPTPPTSGLTSAATVRPTRPLRCQPAALNSMCDAVFSLGAALFIWTTRTMPSAPRLVNIWFIIQDAHEPQPGTRPGRPHVDAGRAEESSMARLRSRRSGHGVFGPDRRLDPRQAAVRRWFEEYCSGSP